VDSRVAYFLLVALLALCRLGELALARRNRLRLLAQGAFEAAPEHYRWMVLLHTAFLISAPAEVWLLHRPFLPPLAAAAALALAAAMALRFWVIATLKGRWTTRIVVLPGAPPITSGPYRFLRHPNYLAVAVETLALPLLHSAWWTATVFSTLNALLLRVRIAREEEALARSSSYAADFAGRPRLLPGTMPGTMQGTK
jgi:methyltransferase